MQSLIGDAGGEVRPDPPPAGRAAAALVDGMKARGLVSEDGGFTPAGREAKQHIEALTDDLALAPYPVLDAAEVGELTAALEPLAAALVAAQNRG